MTRDSSRRGFREANGWRDRRGFTLVELLVVAAIATIVALIALQNYRAQLPYDQIEQAQGELLTGLRRARTDAITRSANVTVTISPANLSYNVDVMLPDGGVESRTERLTVRSVTLTVTRTSVTFLPTGLLSDASAVAIATVTHPRAGSRYVVVMPSGLIEQTQTPVSGT
jgi:prepilin-type N-terminal cleavage/methylation domain-containing protein